MASLDQVSIAILLGAMLVMAGILSSLLALRFGAPLLLVVWASLRQGQRGGLLTAGAAGHVRAQSPDEATRLLQEYVRIDTSNPPGDTRRLRTFWHRFLRARAFLPRATNQSLARRSSTPG